MACCAQPDDGKARHAGKHAKRKLGQGSAAAPEQAEQAAKRAKAELELLRIGARVKFVDLVDKADLNGTLATITSPCNDKGRWGATTLKGYTLSAKAANLCVVASGATAGTVPRPAPSQGPPATVSMALLMRVLNGGLASEANRTGIVEALNRTLAADNTKRLINEALGSASGTPLCTVEEMEYHPDLNTPSSQLFDITRFDATPSTNADSAHFVVELELAYNNTFKIRVRGTRTPASLPERVAASAVTWATKAWGWWAGEGANGDANAATEAATMTDYDFEVETTQQFTGTGLFKLTVDEKTWNPGTWTLASVQVLRPPPITFGVGRPKLIRPELPLPDWLGVQEEIFQKTFKVAEEALAATKNQTFQTDIPLTNFF